MAANSIQKFADCDLVIRPETLSGYTTFSMNSIDAIFEIGYNSSKEALEGVKLIG